MIGDDQFQRAVLAAAPRPDVAAAVGELYARLEREIQRRKPICELSGRCCRFEEFGHRLFVTTMEMAVFLAQRQTASMSQNDQVRIRAAPPGLPPSGGPTPPPPVPLIAHTHSASKPTGDCDGAGCPFQVKKMCSVHLIRPFGCRMFFCDSTSTAWQNEQYELFHADLKRLHDELAVPYFYVEWRGALAAVRGDKGKDEG